ncbi:hypothetical protein [Acaryochloris sp. IP29b_bin.137]|uniref:hypothetical protein n=1 Tax=Acaryochloris sp. IP29b_bin.137 TaxID=2969217 RepID=UPI00261C82B1|nr:hypothetical protein [Acaryochloris sp. IP29b_bin.137]
MQVKSMLLAMTLLIGCAAEPLLKKTQMSQFQPKQVWTYKTRPGEEASRVVILKIDDHDQAGKIVHIHVRGVAIQNQQASGGVTTVISHMPYAENALANSVIAVESEAESLPDFQKGYATWKRAFDKGEGGIFTIPVAEGVDIMQNALNSSSP